MRRAGLLVALVLLAAGALPATAADGDRTTEEEEPSPDLLRFGEKLPDAAFGAYQRGLYITAYNLALPRAEAGDPAAQTLVAEILSRGLGKPRDQAAAADWYRKAAEAGVPAAQFQYALILLDGRYAGPDRERAYELMKDSAEAGDRLAMFNFAQMLTAREPGGLGLEKAIPFYEKAAKAGLADAQYAMAQIRANGVGGQKKDEAKARDWLVLAARQNYDTAQLDLATWLVEGRGGARDYEAGFAWMKRAAQSGNVAARNRLAKLYVNGLGTEPDSVEAAAWYITARRAGLRDPELDDFLRGLTPEQQKQAIERANRLR